MYRLHIYIFAGHVSLVTITSKLEDLLLCMLFLIRVAYTSACVCGVVVFVEGFIVFNFSSTPVFVVCSL